MYHKYRWFYHQNHLYHPQNKFQHVLKISQISLVFPSKSPISWTFLALHFECNKVHLIFYYWPVGWTQLINDWLSLGAHMCPSEIFDLFSNIGKQISSLAAKLQNGLCSWTPWLINVWNTMQWNLWLISWKLLKSAKKVEIMKKIYLTILDKNTKKLTIWCAETAVSSSYRKDRQWCGFLGSRCCDLRSPCLARPEFDIPAR